MNSFYSSFIEKVKKPTCIEGIFTYFSGKKEKKSFAFVEGEKDIKFYSIFFHKKINENNKDILYIRCGSKIEVIETLINLKRMVNLNKHFFIVDRDYDGLSKVPIDLKDKIIITKYYSIENYLFENDNLMKTLKFIGLMDLEIDIFNKCFNDFISLITPYENYSYKRVKDNKIYKVNKQLSMEDIIINNSKCELANDFIKEFETFENNKEKKSINNYLYFRGHNLEQFFDKFMCYFKIDEKLGNLLENSRLINELSIEINIK